MILNLKFIFLGQTAFDLAKDVQMEQVLCVKPVRQLQKTVTRFDGQLLRRSRFLGWKPVWVRFVHSSTIGNKSVIVEFMIKL